MSRPVTLHLEDGSQWAGDGFGAASPTAGEVVFSTAMTGYVETLTDPSFIGQIVVLTYPLVGNYGVPPPRSPDASTRLTPPYQSRRIQARGLVVHRLAPRGSHHDAARPLEGWLDGEGVPGVQGIDTRALTLRLREHGTLRGWLVPGGLSLDDVRTRAWPSIMEELPAVLPAAPVMHGESGPLVLLVDAGAKDELLRCLLARGARVLRVSPSSPELLRLAADADGVLLGNGPGDPRDHVDFVRVTRELLASYARPILGVCLGHQILALASGAKTYKLPYGHRGANQPVRDRTSQRCFVTSQNHGYAVDDASIAGDWEPWFVNLNDDTNEGMWHRARPIRSVQFHPEARPGPEDTAFVLDELVREVRQGAASRA